MTKLDDYVNDKYNGASDWFVEFVKEIHNQNRVDDVMDKKEYLNGKHKIQQKQSYYYNGKEFEPTKIVLQYAKTLLNFQQAYLLQNPVTLTGNQDAVRAFQKVNRKGKYDRVNRKILDKILKYGECAEYVYVDNDNVIKSKVIDPSEGYPVYDKDNTLIAFVQAFMNDGIEYYTVYQSDVVTEYDNNGGDIRFVGQYNNLSGLPIVYHNDNELSDVEGKSELDDWIGILDQMESILSKYNDAVEKFIDPIFINTGQELKGSGLPSDIVGKGINLEDGGNAFYLQGELDSKSFESVWKTLLQSLLDISQTPAVSMNKTDISNLSEVSIKLLFQLANIKASGNEEFMRQGMEDRHDKIRYLLSMQGVEIDDDDYDTLDMVFHYATPSNDKEIIEMLNDLQSMGAISKESILENSPFTNDVQMEMDKIINDDSLGNNLGNNNNSDED